MRLVLHDGAARGEHLMRRHDDGVWELFVGGARAGNRYSYRVDDMVPRPDPASRFQPLGVHGPSEIVDPSSYRWTHTNWSGISPAELILYELHVGTFSETGTFRGAAARLPELRELGITAIELMPVADFAGERNWGYDGVALFAPSRAYGHPDDLRALIDAAHTLGLAVLLDVVYNHLGPEGAYLPEFNPRYLTDRHSTPWGAAVNLDGPGSHLVRRFIIDNAVHWVREYRLDGLRFDATHALIDTSPTHLLRELRDVVKRVAPEPIVLHAEDYRNLDGIVRADAASGWGFDGVWADDFHHIVRRLVAGDEHGYYADFQGTTDELSRTIRQGWLYIGESSRHLNAARGTDPSAVPMNRFIVCIQNHDQIGNRAFGDRLNHQIDPATWRAISALLLTSPMTPLIFMGQEWAASTPFQFFTDFEPELGNLVTQGRRREFQDFPQFSKSDARERIPDPQSKSTFEASRLNWHERHDPQHEKALALYRDLLALRRTEPGLQASAKTAGEAVALDNDTIAVRRRCRDHCIWTIARLRGGGRAELSRLGVDEADARGDWELWRTTEDAAFACDPTPVHIEAGPNAPLVGFARPGAVIFKVATRHP